MPRSYRCPGPLRRREFLQAGALACGGLLLPDVLRARAATTAARTDTAVILLYLHGGPSQLETYDLKPAAPSEYRSVFRPIATRTPGLDICELFPLQARVADRIALVRSVHHTMTSHSDGGIEVLTGKTPLRPDPTSTSRSEHPCLGAIASKLRGYAGPIIPPYVAIPTQLYMVRPSYLGSHHGAFHAGDPAQPDYRLPRLTLPAGFDGARLGERRRLRDAFDALRRELDVHGNLEGADQFRQLAYQLLTSPHVGRAFDLAQESERLRERYGRHLWGQGCLLARRLAEAGTAVITLYIDTPRQGQEFTNWDDHILNAGRPGHFADYLRVRLPYLDQALSALIEDIYERGLDEKIMVVALGEFGRTPRLSHNASGTGRDHWPDAMTVLFAGGGLRVGQVVGATNGRAEYPTQRPYTPQDVLATIYQHLGIDPHGSFLDPTGRPVKVLADGAPIRELV